MTRKPNEDIAPPERWRAGDASALEQLFDRYADMVVRFFRTKIRSEADELAQQTFLRLLESPGRIRSGASLRSFILGIARNVLHEQLRMTHTDGLDPNIDSLASLNPGTSTRLDTTRRYHLLASALRQLPLEHQTAIELYYWEGLPSNEIATIFAVSHSAMASKVAKARSLLLDELVELNASAEMLASAVEDLDEWADDLARINGRVESCPP